MKKLGIVLIGLILALSFCISQVQYPLYYLKLGFHISYVANYPTIPKIDGGDDVITGLDLNKNGKLEILAINDPTVSSPSSQVQMTRLNGFSGLKTMEMIITDFYGALHCR